MQPVQWSLKSARLVETAIRSRASAPIDTRQSAAVRSRTLALALQRRLAGPKGRRRRPRPSPPFHGRRRARARSRTASHYFRCGSSRMSLPLFRRGRSWRVTQRGVRGTRLRREIRALRRRCSRHIASVGEQWTSECT